MVTNRTSKSNDAHPGKYTNNIIALWQYPFLYVDASVSPTSKTISTDMMFPNIYDLDSAIPSEHSPLQPWRSIISRI